MFRRLLTLIVAVSIAVAGSVPAMAMPAQISEQASVQAVDEAAETDCMKAMQPLADDCCDKGDKGDKHGGKSNCLYDDACAARCHVNAAVVQTPQIVVAPLRPTAVLHAPSPSPPYAERPGPLYRPPIA